jgi:hypothetical protein
VGDVIIAGGLQASYSNRIPLILSVVCDCNTASRHEDTQCPALSGLLESERYCKRYRPHVTNEVGHVASLVFFV